MGLLPATHAAVWTRRRAWSLALMFLLGLVLIARMRMADNGTSDFEQYYMGGLIALKGAWPALYAVPREGATSNPGIASSSTVKPGYGALAHEYGVPTRFRFIQHPAAALLYAPYALMPFLLAHKVHLALSLLAACAVMLIAGRVYRLLPGATPRGEVLVQLLVALSPLTLAAIRVANVTPFVALGIGVAILSMLDQAPRWAGAAGLVLGGLLKYVTIALIPLVVVARRGRVILWFGGISAAFAVATLVIAGTKVHLEFLGLLGAMNRSALTSQNQSLLGVLLRLHGVAAPMRPWATALEVARLLAAGAMLWRIASLPASRWKEVESIAAAAALLIGAFLLLGPLTWNHYFYYFCPVWGWLFWTGARGGVLGALAWAALALMWAPAAGTPWGGYLEPTLGRLARYAVNGHLVMSALLTVVVSAVQLSKPPDDRQRGEGKRREREAEVA